MEQLKDIKGQVVCVVEFKESFTSPRYGEYNHQSIVRTTPCIRRGGKLYDLRTEEEFTPVRKNVAIWKISSGTVLQYPDQNILVTRRLHGARNLAILPLSDEELRPTMVLRKLVNKPETKEAA